MSAMASQITSFTIVHSTVYSGADHRKHQSSASLAFVRGIHRWPVNTGEFLAAQSASNAENVSIWWRHHDAPIIFSCSFPPPYRVLQNAICNVVVWASLQSNWEGLTKGTVHWLWITSLFKYVSSIVKTDAIVYPANMIFDLMAEVTYIT